MAGTVVKSWETTYGYKIHQVLSGRSISYLISFDDHSILIDTGKESAYPRLKENIDSLHLANQQITFLILSHAHFDHCQSAKNTAEQYHCQIIVSKRAVDSIINGYTTLPNGPMFIPKLISGFGRIIRKRRFD